MQGPANELGTALLHSASLVPLAPPSSPGAPKASTASVPSPASSQERQAGLLFFVVSPDCLTESTALGSCCLQVTQVWKRLRVTVRSL